MVDVPTLMPARHLNEFVHCPRLFHLEWVSDHWVSDADTAVGNPEHRRVDMVAGTHPDSVGGGFFGSATPVGLPSERWGLDAVIDRVDTATSAGRRPRR